jgi:hypothetical protein
MIDTEDYLFKVFEWDDGAQCITLEPRYTDPLRDKFNLMLRFNLPDGTTIEEADDLAEYMNSHIKSISVQRV